MKLVIVESPTKAKTISKFLSKDYTVKSSYGHLRDLPKSKLGVDIENDFKPEYVIPKDSGKVVNELTKSAKKADGVILATDEDREGEAIAWHLLSALELAPEQTKRITFHEITKKAIDEALNNPRSIDNRLVDAQQARRVLDRLVGYKLSPFLWKKVIRGLSAGRVQSVAVRLIVERERERQDFKTKEYWTVETEFITDKNETIQAQLHSTNGKILKKFDLNNKKQVDDIISQFQKKHSIDGLETREALKNPNPPFTTSTLQQAANRRFGFSARQTMRLAQQLYEGVALEKGDATGLITYMRTDSVNLASSFIDNARSFIQKSFGNNYLTDKPVIYKAKSKLAQEAHEAIRPTNADITPERAKTHLDNQQYKLYQLIWQRAISCQMTAAKIKQAVINIVDEKKRFSFRANGQILTFDGFLKVWPQEIQETILPKVAKNDTVTLDKVKPAQHFTEPPARYSDASLVKTLEEHDIGRPSTYAPTIATIIERGYVERENRRLKPTDIAFLVNDLLVKHFTNIVDYKFTAEMEDKLDKIAQGKSAWQPIIKNFYAPFAKNLKNKETELSKKEITEEATDQSCPECKKPLIIKFGRFGKFYACTGYPDCKHTSPLDKDKKEDKVTDQKCPRCGNKLAVKQSRFGEFLGCSAYPECKYTSNALSKLDIKCPACKQGELVIKKTRRGKPFYACDQYPKCEFALWQKPIAEICPNCQSLLVYGAKDTAKCSNTECKFTKDLKPEA